MPFERQSDAGQVMFRVWSLLSSASGIVSAEQHCQSYQYTVRVTLPESLDLIFALLPFREAFPALSIGCAGVGPAFVGDQGEPAGAGGILVAGVAAEFAEEFGVAVEFLAVETDAKSGTVRDADGAVFVRERTALDYVIGQVVIVGVGGEAEIREEGAEVEHGGELDAEFSARVDRDAEVERFANTGRFDAGTDTAPKGGVEENDVHRRPAGCTEAENILGELFEVDDDGVGGERNADGAADALHRGEAERRVFEVVVVEILDRAAEADGFFGTPDGVGVEANPVVRKRLGDGAVAFEFVARGEDAAFKLVRGESVFVLEAADLVDHLIGGADFGGSVGRVFKKHIRRKPNFVTNPAAEQFRYGNAEMLPDDIETGELDRGQELGPVVVEADCRVAKEKPQILKAERVASDQVRFQTAKGGVGGFPTSAHFAESDESSVSFDLDDGANKAAPVTSIGMAQGGFQGDGDRGWTNACYLHDR